jgi:negative regulator of replication initiation
MKMHSIEVDEEVYDYLKSNAEPFKDTPNTVLRRLLLKIEIVDPKKNDIRSDLPKFSESVPNALAEILEMIFLVKSKGLSRINATHTVAKLRRISTQAVIDKYTRQLRKKAYEIDELLTSPNMNKFKILLVERFPYHKNIVEKVFEQVTT